MTEPWLFFEEVTPTRRTWTEDE